LETVILGGCALLGVFWAFTTDHFPKDWFSLDFLIDVSSPLTVASFSVRGMLPLRVLAAGSQTIAIPYFVLQPTPLWTPTGWTALFLAINLYHIVRILLERRPVDLTRDEQKLYDLAFRTFETRSFLKLVGVGEWKTAGSGHRVITQGEPVERIAVPIAGCASARRGSQEFATLEPGAFIGVSGVLAGRPSPYHVEIAEGSRYLCWAASALHDFLGRNPDLRIKFSEIANHHLADQLLKLTSHLESPEQAP
jgi:CRP-like cAMP-binding protein